MFHMDRLKKIAFRIALGGGVATFIAINTIPAIINGRIRKSEHYKKALEILENHPEAIKYLGKPIKAHYIAVTYKENYGNDDEKKWIRVPVTGPKDRGFLYYDFALKQDNTDSIELSRVELVVEKFKDYKLIIKKPE